MATIEHLKIWLFKTPWLSAGYKTIISPMRKFANGFVRSVLAKTIKLSSSELWLDWIFKRLKILKFASFSSEELSHKDATPFTFSTPCTPTFANWCSLETKETKAVKYFFSTLERSFMVLSNKSMSRFSKPEAVLKRLLVKCLNILFSVNCFLFKLINAHSIAKIWFLTFKASNCWAFTEGANFKLSVSRTEYKM